MVIKKEQLEEINNLRLQKATTLRPVSEELEEILYKPFKAEELLKKIELYLTQTQSVLSK
jgi:hypothetical protein